MELETHEQNNTLLIKVLAERIDAPVAIQFKDMFRVCIQDGPSRVLLDLQNVDFIDSSGLGSVVAAMKYLGRDRALELAGLGEKVAKVFRLTRMDTVFTIHATAEDALTSFKSTA